MPTAYPDPAEAMIAQRGYSAWTMLPSFLVCALLSVLFLLSGRLFEGVRGLGENTGSWILYVITAGFWAIQLLRWFYRSASYVYVLSEKRLLVDRGFRWYPTTPIELSRVERVQWGIHRFSRPFHVGWIRVSTHDGRTETMDGVLNPREFAWLIDNQLAQIRRVDPSLNLPEPVSA